MRLKNEQEWTEVFTERLKNIMKDRGVSNVQLAEIGISENTMINYRTGKSIPNLYIAAKMAEVLNISVDDLASLEYIDEFEKAGFSEDECKWMRNMAKELNLEPEKMINVINTYRRNQNNLNAKEKKNGIFK